MYTVVLAFHVFVCLLLIVVVLIQPSKSGDLSSAFGGGMATDMFGPGAPANLITKVTAIVAACFLLLSLALALMVHQRTDGDSILRNFQQSAPIMQEQTLPPPSAPGTE